MKEQLDQLVQQMYRSRMRYSEAVQKFQRTFILTALSEENVHQIRAANKLGMHRNTLRRTARELGVDVEFLRRARRRPARAERSAWLEKKQRAG